MKNDMFTFISGGTGTPKLLQGFRQVLDDANIGVICNTGDDLSWFDLHVSPDLDTVLYLFSGKLDLDKFWGVKEETFHALDTIKTLRGLDWFNIGDRDLGLHIFRNSLLADNSLSDVTELICEAWNIQAKVHPMSDFPLRSMIHTDIGVLPFQEFFVKHKWEPEITNVTFQGQKENIPPQVNELLQNTKHLIIGPSNPVTSIGPVLSMTPYDSYLQQHRDKVIAISPIVGSMAFSGPSVKLMKAMGINTTVVGLAKHYQNHISKLVIAPEDQSIQQEIEDLSIEPIVLPIELQTLHQKKQLAESLMDIL